MSLKDILNKPLGELFGFKKALKPLEQSSAAPVFTAETVKQPVADTTEHGKEVAAPKPAARREIGGPAISASGEFGIDCGGVVVEMDGDISAGIG